VGSGKEGDWGPHSTESRHNQHLIGEKEKVRGLRGGAGIGKEGLPSVKHPERRFSILRFSILKPTLS